MFYQILLIIGNSILLEGFEFGYEALYISGVGTKFPGCRYNEDFILCDRHEL